MRKKKDIYEKEEKLAKIVTGYDSLAEKFPDEIAIIDGEKEEEEVTSQIIKHL
jgi:thymidylate kinase